MLFASANCAEMTTAVPATGLELFDVTRYFAGAPATVTTLPLVPVRELPSVPVNAYVTPADVPAVNTTVAMPLPFVGDVAVANEPPAPVLVHVMVWPAVSDGVPAASANCALTVTVPPAATLGALVVTT